VHDKWKAKDVCIIKENCNKKVSKIASLLNRSMSATYDKIHKLGGLKALRKKVNAKKRNITQELREQRSAVAVRAQHLKRQGMAQSTALKLAWKEKKGETNETQGKQ
jgi:hypothetical protein